MTTRLGFIGVVVKDRKNSAEAVNKILAEFGETIIARMGVPYPTRKLNIITLVVDTTTDRFGALSGQLGSLPGVTVKSALTQ